MDFHFREKCVIPVLLVELTLAPDAAGYDPIERFDYFDYRY